MAGISMKLPPAQRATRSRALVLQAAVSHILGHGTASLTVEAIAQTTGLAKTTIYRHWPNRAELLAEAIERLGNVAVAPDTGSLRADLLEFFAVRVRLLEDSGGEPGMKTVPGLMEAARHDPNLGAVVTLMVDGLLRTLKIVLERARERGEIDAGRNLDTIADLLIGAVFFRRGFVGQVIGRKYLADMIETVLLGTGPAEAGR